MQDEEGILDTILIVLRDFIVYSNLDFDWVLTCIVSARFRSRNNFGCSAGSRA